MGSVGRRGGPGGGRVRDVLFPLMCLTLSLMCCPLLPFHPALRTLNLTVPLSHNATFVFTNDSAYSNLSATVGEHRGLVPSHLDPRDV